MDNESPELVEELLAGDTPEDVAVLYSWANLQGAKYRDFSASRREYRAQMRLRAVEEQRQAEALAQSEAEAAAFEAEKAAREAEEAARLYETAARKAAVAQQRRETDTQEAAKERALRHAEEMSRIAAAERIEAARRAEAVAAADAAARREVREMEEARVSAGRQAARYAESEVRRKELAGPQPRLVGGEISDPYSGAQQAVPGRIFHQPVVPTDDMMPSRLSQSRDRVIIPPVDPVHPSARTLNHEVLATGSMAEAAALAARGATAIEREAEKHPYHPAASGTVRSIDRPSRIRAINEGSTSVVPIASRQFPPALASLSSGAVPVAQPQASFSGSGFVPPEARASGFVPVAPARLEPSSFAEAKSARTSAILGLDLSPVEHDPEPVAPVVASPRSFAIPEPPAPVAEASPEPISPGQRAYQQARAEAAAKAEAAMQQSRRVRGYQPDEASGFFAAYGSARERAVAAPPSGIDIPAAVPAWLHESSEVLEAAGIDPQIARKRVGNSTVPPPGDTLQRSRERVAARWYALKGIFDYGVQEQIVEKAEVEPRDRNVPMVAVFSLAGGVGKTSLVATLGRALSATGETVLLTDTTSHGLLPFYFGASELRPEVMRTFSPPSGSTDAPICLVSYDVLQKTGDIVSQEWFSKEILAKSTGVSRVVLDLTAAAPWVARRLGRMDATILVPLAPDMNSVISLGAIEKFFTEITDSSGKKVEPVYVLNQFDASQALHLDVREVMRQQLGDRLLPFVIRNAPSVPESLAEGMTVMDYASESSVAEDYRNLAVWLKTQKAPAVSEQKTARWSER